MNTAVTASFLCPFRRRSSVAPRSAVNSDSIDLPAAAAHRKCDLAEAFAKRKLELGSPGDGESLERIGAPLVPAASRLSTRRLFGDTARSGGVPGCFEPLGSIANIANTVYSWLLTAGETMFVPASAWTRLLF